MTEPEIVVHPTAALVAAAVAARLITRLLDAQASRGAASVVLTGGGTGIAVLEQVRAAAARDAVDWSRIDLYWGDERFLPAGDPERNETQARNALLDHVGVDPARIHPMAAAGGLFGHDLDAAAAGYAATLARSATGEDGGGVPCWDVCLLGVGEEGHVASIFPGSPGVHDTGHSVLPVHDSPKPPAARLSLTLPAIRRAREVWLVTAGAAKATALATAVGGASAAQLPAVGACGQQRTLWLLDAAAASMLPGRPPASPLR